MELRVEAESELVIAITAEMQEEVRYVDATTQDAMPIQIDELDAETWRAQKNGMLAERNNCIFDYVLRSAFYRERINFDEEVLHTEHYPGVDGRDPYDAEVIAVTVQFEGKAYRIHQREFGWFIHDKEIRIPAQN